MCETNKYQISDYLNAFRVNGAFITWNINEKLINKIWKLIKSVIHNFIVWKFKV